MIINSNDISFETPRVDQELRFQLNQGIGSDYLARLNRMIPFARKLEIENEVLYQFINREMPMTAGDPRIEELKNMLRKRRDRHQDSKTGIMIKTIR